MELKSPAFENDSDIPPKYTCEGEDISPSVEFSGIPLDAKSLVLFVDDPDAPDPAAPKMVWDHWVMFNIPADAGYIPEGSTVGTSGTNSWGTTGYGGPCPPVGKHRYFFKLFALDTRLDLQDTATKADVEAAMEGHVLEKTELIGLYQKASSTRVSRR